MANSSVNTNLSTGTTTETYSVKSRGVNHVVSHSYTEPTYGFKIGVLGLFVGALLIIGLVRSLLGAGSVSFTGLLQYLSSAPVIDMSLKNLQVIPTFGDWGVFNFLATFFNFFIDLNNVLIYICRGLFQCIQYLWYFIKFIFV